MRSELLRAGLQELALDLSADAQDALEYYLGILMRWNRAYNLTAIRDPEQIIIKHLLDCLTVVAHLPKGRIIDVGSGAGLPAIPLALSRQDLLVTALDRNSKKTRFITQAVLELRIKNLIVVQHSVEDYFTAEPFNMIIARAFASLTDLIRATAHLLVPGGKWFAMKAHILPRELANLPSECSAPQVIPLLVPYLDAPRNLIVLQKTTTAPLSSYSDKGRESIARQGQ